MPSLTLRSLSGIPELRPGDDLAALIVATARSDPASARSTFTDPGASQGGSATSRPGGLRDGNIVVIAQKAVSKVEGAVVALSDVTPTARAIELATASRPGSPPKDPRAVQVVLDQSAEILRAERGVLICRTHHGLTCANAGVDASNSEPGTLIVLPADPDRSARRIRARLRELTGCAPAVLITDSFGRAWRHGQCDTAIGCAGLVPLDDWRGRHDSAGRELSATWLAVADSIAAASDLARAKDSREPVVVVEGLGRFVTHKDGPGAAALIRPLGEDLFR